MTLSDDGGTAGGGVNTTATVFTIFVDPVPKVVEISIKHPWKSDCIPVTLSAWDSDTDPYPTSTPGTDIHTQLLRRKIKSLPSKGLLYDYGGSEYLTVRPPFVSILDADGNPIGSRPYSHYNTTLCYASNDPLFVGTDAFTYAVVDKDGNESPPALFSIYIYEVK